MKNLMLLIVLATSIVTMAQEKQKLPYYEIPEEAETYTAGTVASRMMDGLGFRYYWATEGLRAEDLSYKASESGRTSEETIDHILGLSNFILNSISETANRSEDETLTFEDKRAKTLLNIEKASNILKGMTDLSKFDNDRFPFWNIINGPISDALWHCGQVVMLRRASGNPFNSKASLFSGKLRE